MRIWFQTGRLEYHIQKYANAMESFGKAHTLAQEFDDQLLRARCLIRMGQVKRRQTEWEAAVSFFRQAHGIANKSQDKKLAFECETQLGVIAQKQNLFEEAAEHYAAARQIAQDINDRLAEETSLSHAGRLDYIRGRLSDAEQFLRKALDIARPMHNFRGVRIELTRLIDVLIEVNENEARELLTESESHNRRTDDLLGIAWNLKQRGQLEKRRGNVEAGNNLIRQGIQQLAEIGFPEYIPEFEAALKI
jgi:tetratricopeptide (TPR) repeat protein